MATASRKYRLLLAWLTVCAVLAFVLSQGSGMSYPAAFGLVAIALSAWTAVVYIDDHAPGGDLNPDGTETPKWLTRLGAVVRWLGIALMLLGSAVLAITLSEKTVTFRLAPSFVALVVSPLFLALYFFDGRKFRWAAWVASGLFAIAIPFLALAT